MNLRTIARAVFAGWCASAGTGVVPGQGDEGFPRPLDLARIRELYHLTDTLGAELWPGFDARAIPIAVNDRDERELLVGHPRPPAGFEPLERRAIDGVRVLLRDGVTRYGPTGGGWAIDLGGAKTAYVGPLQDGRTTESWLSLLLHECFHCYQPRYRQRGAGRSGQLPEDDAYWSAMVGLESRVLHAALKENGPDQTRALARAFVAVRHARRKELPAPVVRAEGEHEWNEGTATYVQARMFQLLAQSGGIEPAMQVRDPHYARFAAAADEYRRYVARILPPDGLLISSMHLQYHVGMAQCLLLDRLRPGWKAEMREPGATQFALLELEVPIPDGQAAELVASTRERFAWDELFAGQRRLLDARLAEIRGYLDAPGRRYRVYHGDVRGAFRWKPRGPVFRVPDSRWGGDAPGGMQATIWAGGIRRFEKGDLVLESKDVPMIFRSDYVEWIDRDPAPDFDDLLIGVERIDGDVHVGLELVTDGFTLRTPRARVVRTDALVTIRPLGR